MFDFNPLVPQEDTLKFMGKEYFMREASEAAVASFQNCMISSAKMSDEGKFLGLGNMATANSLLISKCLFERLPDGKDGANPPVEEVSLWPHRVTAPVLKWIKDVSGLNTDETAEFLKKRIAEDTIKLEKLSSKNS